MTDKSMTTLLIVVYITLAIVLGLIIFLSYTIFYVPEEAAVSCAISNDNISILTEDMNNTTDMDIEQYSSVFEWQENSYVGDFKIEQMNYLRVQCEKYDIPMEIMLSIICTESSFRSTAVSNISSAAGYCQVIHRTAKWVYEDLLKYGDYNYTIDEHKILMTENWKLNIEISCRLMYCNYWNSDQSWDMAIQKYYGSTDKSQNIEYLNRVNYRMSELFDMTTVNFK